MGTGPLIENRPAADRDTGDQDCRGELAVPAEPRTEQDHGGQDSGSTDGESKPRPGVCAVDALESGRGGRTVGDVARRQREGEGDAADSE
jgi:hypothetical protein